METATKLAALSAAEPRLSLSVFNGPRYLILLETVHNKTRLGVEHLYRVVVAVLGVLKEITASL